MELELVQEALSLAPLLGVAKDKTRGTTIIKFKRWAQEVHRRTNLTNLVKVKQVNLAT